MKLKGSITIEASVIVPLFTIMVIQIIILAMDCHDMAIVNCASTKVCMNMEFNGYEAGEYRSDMLQELSIEGTQYLKEKTIKANAVVELESTITSIKTELVAIEKNNPMEFVRMTDAAKKLIGED